MIDNRSINQFITRSKYFIRCIHCKQIRL